ncbi:MAG: lipopolysaccharide transport periplasmic protein LptA [Chromatiaceae bacterium]|nr:lipopolysaccharide transport periplasmic protein LptA [Chromatiaceae bacterium]MCP5315161.1 lipopolysaccharide transport periplasmic protein LptA [Chromatiaceae bacterium]
MSPKPIEFNVSRCLWTWAAALMLACGPATALESDNQQPIELSADYADIDEAKGISVYKGDVDLRQGTLRLRADVLTVHHAGRKPSKMIAEGKPVHFEQQSDEGPVKGQSRRAEYEVNTENLVLIGDAVVVQNKDTMRSDRIVYDRVHSVVKAGAAAQGKQRVQITIQPPAK